TDNPGDYIAGFPSHPHRGFQTVTYMLDGRMQHRDHLGNVGDLGPGGVQWMSAGRGVIHSEMPLQESGRMRGFQLWINLPGKDKLQPAWYRDIPAAEIPVAALPDGGTIKVIAGSVQLGAQTLDGPINGSAQRLSTDPLYIDLDLPPGARHQQVIGSGHNAFIYTYEGSVTIGDGATAKTLPAQAAGVLTPGEQVTIVAGAQGARLVLIAGQPIREPVVQYGPFVMNTREEIEQAIRDYNDGTLTQAAA
ncbi:pirin family protein, partial [Nevskia ramosa]|uniref:pirin family protein n=1 Tax=Nevskia ramosa TaxID=64002 RepID=UPI0023568852